MSMLQYFLDQSQSSQDNIFQGLEIAKDREFCQQHQNQYPVIFISFIKYSDYARAYEGIATLIMELHRNHRYLLDGDLLHEDEKAVFTALLYKKADSTDVQITLKQLAISMKRKFNSSSS